MLISVLLNRLVLSRSLRMLVVLIDHSGFYKKSITVMQILPIMPNLSALVLTALIGALMVWIVLNLSVLVLTVLIGIPAKRFVLNLRVLLVLPVPIDVLMIQLAPSLGVLTVLNRGAQPFRLELVRMVLVRMVLVRFVLSRVVLIRFVLTLSRLLLNLRRLNARLSPSLRT